MALAAALAVSATTAPAQTIDAMMARGRALSAACPEDQGDAIVVCGRADPASRYRLPLPDEREREARPSGQGLGQTELFKSQGSCVPVGPRRCTKREALSQGLGGGRNPLDQAIRLGDRLINGE